MITRLAPPAEELAQSRLAFVGRGIHAVDHFLFASFFICSPFRTTVLVAQRGKLGRRQHRMPTPHASRTQRQAPMFPRGGSMKQRRKTEVLDHHAAASGCREPERGVPLARGCARHFQPVALGITEAARAFDRTAPPRVCQRRVAHAAWHTFPSDDPPELIGILPRWLPPRGRRVTTGSRHTKPSSPRRRARSFRSSGTCSATQPSSRRVAVRSRWRAVTRTGDATLLVTDTGQGHLHAHFFPSKGPDHLLERVP
jgi:hypothetical protein